MEILEFNSVEEAKKSYNTGDPQKDLSIVNAILSGNVKIKENEEKKVIDEESIVENNNQQIEDQKSNQPTVDFIQSELERQKLYAELVEKRRIEEKEELLLRNKEIEEKLIKERKDREELEKKLQELEQLKNERNKSSQLNDTINKDDDDEEEFVNEYTKKTRKMVEELKNSIGKDNPIISQLTDEVYRIKQDYEQEKNERKRSLDLKKEQERQEKVFNNIRQFIIQHPELKPSKDISELDQEYKNFRRDIAYLTKSKTLKDLESAIEDYQKGGSVKELADQNGIKPFKDIDKYNFIAELLDFQAGLKYDSTKGQHIPILDENGVQVRYGSLEEAFNIKNYYNNLTNIKRQAYKDVSKKLEQFNNSPATLSPEQTESFKTNLTLEQEKEILNMNPKEWANNPEKRRLVEMVYSKYNIELPRYRGRR
jgi:hypothetical protein